MLHLTCDRCGERIEKGEKGRNRWRFAGGEVVVDLCPICTNVIVDLWDRITHGRVLPTDVDWANDPFGVIE